jgi:tryptophan 2,3-dioxygenase
MSFGRPDDQIRYGSYLCIPQLLELQRPLTKEHDEMQFIVVHQAYELWFRLILHELDGVMALLEPKNPKGRADDDALGEARRLLDRVAKIQDVLLQHLPVVETMRPADFLRFRDVLKPASGFQSVQFREIEFLAGLKDQALFERCDADPKSMASLKARLDGPTLRERFAAAARSRGFDVQVAAEGAVEYQLSVRELCRLYQTPTPDAVLCALAEAFCDFDERLIVWRSRHISMVERVIGGKIGTGYAATGAGYEGVRYLATTLRKRAFPELWDVRTQLGEMP